MPQQFTPKIVEVESSVVQIAVWKMEPMQVESKDLCGLVGKGDQMRVHWVTLADWGF
jgi:hypothetical protein